MLRLRSFVISFLIIFTFFLFNGCNAKPEYRGPGPMKVLLVSGDSSCSISSKGSVVIRNFSSRKGLFKGKLDTISLKYSSRGIIAGEKLYKADGLLVSPRSGAELLVNGNAYRGSIIIQKVEGALSVVNYIDVEDYVKGVMTNEIIASWDEEALKVQAVAARTFAIYHILRYPDRYYNITSTKIMYKGKDTEDARTNRAVDLTKGEVLYYDGSLLLTHFCSSCGGHTEYAGNVWEARFKFPKGVPCPYCRKSSDSSWTKTLSKAFIAQKLRKAGVDVRGIKLILPYRKSIFGGRLTHLQIKQNGRTRTVTINKFRLAIGSDVIRSGFMTIENRKNDVVFTGKGWGHGVGMCQWGAKSMADLGYSYESILAYYYPGSKLKRIKY